MRTRPLAVLALLTLGECSDPAPVTEELLPTPAPTPAATPTAQGRPDAEAAFIAFADDDTVEVPWADLVEYSVMGTAVARFDAGFAARHDTWRCCPDGMETYEGRECPVSPLRTVAIGAAYGEIVTESKPPRVIGCNRYHAPDVGTATSVWLRPDESQRNCFSDFAIQVAVDGDGRITAVDLALSGP